jgi:hypothetical protein
MQRALPWFGLEISFNGLTWAVIKLALVVGALVLLALHGPV